MDRGKVSFAPVARSHDNQTLSRAGHEHLQHKLDLVHQRDAGHGVFAVRADHNVIGEVDQAHQHILQRDDAGQAEKRAVKRLVPGKKTVHDFYFPFLKSPIYL